MAQTRRKRNTKHRGNAAGMIEARGRTGRKPTAGERKSDVRSAARDRREARMNKPPTWRGAIQKAVLAAVVFAVAVAVIFHKPSQALVTGPLILLLYIPMSYYTDLFIYRRAQARKLQRGKP
jgi:anti-sigma-K factor RskA